jgi:hypothetical protein
MADDNRYTYTTADDVLGGGKPLKEDNPVALEASSVSRTDAGKILFAYGYNTSASLLFFQLFNATSLPVDTTVPRLSGIPVPASGTFSFSPRNDVIRFDTGIVWALSTTLATLTVATAVGWVHLFHQDK